MVVPDAADSPLIEAFTLQIDWCRKLHSPYMVALLECSVVRLRDDADAAALLAGATEDPRAGLVPLRWAAALHDLALQGREPWSSLVARGGEVAGAGRKTDGTTDRRTDITIDRTLHDTIDHAIDTLLRDERELLAGYLRSPPQTNEVQRSVSLLPGLLHVARQTGLPLHLLEIGSSAGLNLWCERWFYDHGVWCWGDPASPLRLHTDWRGPAPAQQPALSIAGRAGCDQAPMDAANPEHRRRLAAYVWADQHERLRRLTAALDAAAGWGLSEGVGVEAIGAAAFAERELAPRREGCATVIFHSVVWQYLAGDEKARLRTAIEAAGARATPSAPLAWLSLEHPRAAAAAELRCRLWPPGQTAQPQLLAHTHPHGAWVEWQAPA